MDKAFLEVGCKINFHRNTCLLKIENLMRFSHSQKKVYGAILCESIKKIITKYRAAFAANKDAVKTPCMSVLNDGSTIFSGPLDF